MRTKQVLGFLAITLASLGIASCNSTTSEVDADITPTPDAGPTLYPMSDGTYCYDVLSITSGYADGCLLGVETLVGNSLPGTYDAATGTFTLGTEGSLGIGLLSNNTGTLLRDGTVTDSSAPACTWHQSDTTVVVLTGQNQFTAAVTELENTFATACADIPTGGTCTSTWQWTMAINAAKDPTTGCQ